MIWLECKLVVYCQWLTSPLPQRIEFNHMVPSQIGVAHCPTCCFLQGTQDLKLCHWCKRISCRPMSRPLSSSVCIKQVAQLWQRDRTRRMKSTLLSGWVTGSHRGYILGWRVTFWNVRYQNGYTTTLPLEVFTQRNFDRGRLPIRHDWTFFAISYGWDVISGNLSKSAFFEGDGSVWAHISDERRRRPSTTVGVRKLEWLPFRMVSKYPQCIVWFCHKARLCRTDRKTDGRTRTDI